MLTRRAVVAGLGVVAAVAPGTVLAGAHASVRRNVSSFTLMDWRDHFGRLGKGIIIANTVTRALQHWAADGEMRVYPTSVPRSDDLTRRGYTEVVFKDPEPDWAPTPSMIERDPTLPRYVPPGPDNPLGIRALHLSWQYYRIHGTDDTRKIGRRSSSGCIGLYNVQIVELFDRVPVGTQVKLV